MTITTIAEGLADAGAFFSEMPGVAAKAARLAVNDVTRDIGFREARREMESQVAFPPGYLNDKSRFQITKFATEDDLEARVRARQRATSLARFSTGGAVGRTGVRVQVARGRTREMGRAFIIRLPQGRAALVDGGPANLGLAIRLKPGEAILNKNVSVGAGPGGLTLLYGPSVDQVFRSVADDLSPRIVDELASEFLRQFVRLAGGARA